MVENDDLGRWWDGLTKEERAYAIRSAEAGQLSEEMGRSLENAGLITGEERTDRTVPGKIRNYVKMRH